MNIVILGGGTAGWLTALYADKYFKGSKIKLIESSKVGILGAGEGTTPQIMKTIKVFRH
jgi:protoporphyrinogen oxidase